MSSLGAFQSVDGKPHWHIASMTCNALLHSENRIDGRGRHTWIPCFGESSCCMGDATGDHWPTRRACCVCLVSLVLKVVFSAE